MRSQRRKTEPPGSAASPEGVFACLGFLTLFRSGISSRTDVGYFFSTQFPWNFATEMSTQILHKSGHKCQVGCK